MLLDGALVCLHIKLKPPPRETLFFVLSLLSFWGMVYVIGLDPYSYILAVRVWH